ncbi:Transposase DDE domain protein [Luteitalea pratensis]|uniref:Transposase DDE domain protein n=1 Tax=Luteitalea pratensis TaxID=1855912 RepID=A0A143PME2_LUTPR|nr:Transposase DDE domain protein [Luteitalea pratensis]
MKSRVHPTHKTHYRVGNWRAYERALVRRGDVTLWLSPDARVASGVPPSGRAGGQQRFSNLAIETGLTLRLVFRLPMRQTEGFLRSILTVMRTNLDAPDHTTLSRREQLLNVAGHKTLATGPLHLIVDSTGLSVVGEGEWAAAKHGGRGTRGWKKLHLGVDRSGMIVAHALTEATVDEATVGIDLIGAAAGGIASVTADAAYDTVAFMRPRARDTHRWSCRRSGRQRCRATDHARVCTIARSPTWKRSVGANGRRPRATTGRSASRMPSSATSPSLAMVFGPVVVVAEKSRRAWRAAS